MKVNDYFRVKLGRYAIRVRRPWPAPEDVARAEFDLSWQTDPQWAAEGGAMLALTQCLPASAWTVWHEDAMLWVIDRSLGWQARGSNSDRFEKCVLQQSDSGEIPGDKGEPTERGKTSAAILEQKLSVLLLEIGCTGKGPDRCLPLLHALYSLNPKHPQLPAILKKIEPEFKLNEPLAILPTSERLLSDGDLDKLDKVAREAIRRLIYLDIKLPVLMDRPDQFPAGELERTTRTALQLEMLRQQVREQSMDRSGFAKTEREYARPLPALGQLETMSAERIAMLVRLGQALGVQPGCSLPQAMDIPEAALLGYGLAKLGQGKTECQTLSPDALMKLYRRGRKAPEFIQPLQGLQAYLTAKSPLVADPLFSADVAAACKKLGPVSPDEPWGLCAWAKKHAAVQETQKDREAQASFAGQQKAGPQFLRGRLRLLPAPPQGKDHWELAGRFFKPGSDWLALACQSGSCALLPANLHTKNVRVQLSNDADDIAPGQRLQWKLVGAKADTMVIAVLQAKSGLPWLKPGAIKVWYGGVGRVPRAAGPGTLEAAILDGKTTLARLRPLLVRHEDSQPDSMRLELLRNRTRQALGEFTTCDDEQAGPVTPESYLRWAGDLDGDGQPDYLISTHQTGPHLMLYLSSLAGPGEIVGLAGEFDLEENCGC